MDGLHGHVDPPQSPAARELNAGNPDLAFVTFPGGHDYRQSDVEAMYLWLRQFEN